MDESGRLDRREFLRRGALAGVGVGLAPLAGVAATDAPGVRRHALLGRTGLRVPDIGFGSSRLAGDEALVRHALDRGITYFDTAESYTDGQSEETLGRALEGVRDRVLIASKVEAGARDTGEQMMRALEASLRRLRTDRIDVYFNHAVNDVERLKNPEWPAFLERARKQGKIRFSGVSGHGGRLGECLEYAIDHDLADVLLVAHNFGQDPSFYERFTATLDFVAVQPALPGLMKRAKEKGIGVVAMKTLRGARLNDMRPYEGGGATFAQAALRWVLSGPHVDSLVVTMRSPEMVDEYLGASGYAAPDHEDVALLRRYEVLNRATQCRYGCDACAASCSAGVPIAEVLRARMYAHDYGDLEQGRRDYARLGEGAGPCVGCRVRSGAGAGPHGVAIEALTAPAHRLLAG
ncbi:MAG TPA: aldo/keto reductase [Myxococcota bacterium]